MKKVTKYEAEDGTLHDTADKARQHEAEVDLEDWYRDHALIAGNDTNEDVIYWLKENASDLALLLEDYLNLRPRKARKES